MGHTVALPPTHDGPPNNIDDMHRLEALSLAQTADRKIWVSSPFASNPQVWISDRDTGDIKYSYRSFTSVSRLGETLETMGYEITRSGQLMV